MSDKELPIGIGRVITHLGSKEIHLILDYPAPSQRQFALVMSIESAERLIEELNQSLKALAAVEAQS